jgi:hypothetical protein
MNINDLTLPLKGSCHCGNVKFEVNTKLKDLRRKRRRHEALRSAKSYSESPGRRPKSFGLDLIKAPQTCVQGFASLPAQSRPERKSGALFRDLAPAMLMVIHKRRMTPGIGTSVNRETMVPIAISLKTPLISSVGITTPRIRSTELLKTMRLDFTSTITKGTAATNEARIAPNHG